MLIKSYFFFFEMLNLSTLKFVSRSTYRNPFTLFLAEKERVLLIFEHF